MDKTYKVGLLVFFFCYCFHHAGAQNSTDISPPKVWLRTDMGDLSDSTWHDVSGNENHVNISASHSTTEAKTFNFNPTRQFLETDDSAIIPFSVEGLSEITFIVVYQPSDTAERGIIGTKNGVERNLMLTTSRVLGPDSVIDVFEAGRGLINMTTITQNWEDAKFPGEEATLTFGSIINDEVKDFNGAIAELLVFDEVLPFLERVQYETYLAIKYGISLKDRNYVNSRGIVLWKAEENEDYGYRIAGIGRDDHFKLYQQKSCSSIDSTQLLTISTGESREDNTTAALANQTFILWGDNNQALTISKGEGRDSILSVLDRKWLILMNGNTGRIPTQLALNISHLPQDSLGFWLVIDRSASNNFSVDNLEYIKADSISGDTIAYYNILWDTDRSGKDHFSFAKVKNLFAVARTISQPVCTDPHSGKVKIEVVAGTAPFELEWSLIGSDEKEKFVIRDSVVIDKLLSGTYNMQIKDKNGAILNRAIPLIMANGVPVSLGPDQALEQGKAIILDATSAIPDSLDVEYAWESSFGFGSTSGKINVTETGIYRVFVTNKANGCIFSDEVTISGSPIQRYELFPNLIHQNESFNISISLKEPLTIQLRVLDVKGNLHSEINGKGSSEYQFQVSLQRAGHYTIVLETPDGVSAKKIIVY